MNPLSFLLVCFAGWMNRRQQAVIEYLQEEVRVLEEQLGKGPRFTDGHQALENKIIRLQFAEFPQTGTI